MAEAVTVMVTGLQAGQVVGRSGPVPVGNKGGWLLEGLPVPQGAPAPDVGLV